ncbi:MAG: hypothetical protein JWP27_1884 [Flaviaesturariibacter sp.]|nr:hypothetical protein [Flaviaesturariibacter sp.]
MDFGKLPVSALDSIDLSLPDDPRLNGAVLTGVRADRPRVYTGGTQWGLKEWVGTFYPAGTRESGFLDAYIRQYNCVELNATHYKIHPPETMRKWAEKAAGTDFRFCPKLFADISHKGLLTDQPALLAAFMESIGALGTHLGPVFMQLPERFGPERAHELYAFLEGLSCPSSFFVELRHPAWFAEPHRTEVFRQFHRFGIGAVITDTAGRRDACHMHLSIQRTFVRFVANSLHPTDYSRVDEWAQRTRQWIDNGLEEMVFIQHMRDETFAPGLASYIAETFNRVAGINLHMPVQHRPPELF